MSRSSNSNRNRKTDVVEEQLHNIGIESALESQESIAPPEVEVEQEHPSDELEKELNKQLEKAGDPNPNPNDNDPDHDPEQDEEQEDDNEETETEGEGEGEVVGDPPSEESERFVGFTNTDTDTKEEEEEDKEKEGEEQEVVAEGPKWPDFDKVAYATCSTISAKIRFLDATGGWSRGAIAKFLTAERERKVLYQHVRNVLLVPVKNPKRA